MIAVGLSAAESLFELYEVEVDPDGRASEDGEEEEEDLALCHLERIS